MTTISIQTILQGIAPYVFGALGACVFLLRALHQYIYERTFDRRHQPEYYNRILLGMISGGILSLLLNGDTGPVANVSKLGLAFVAGYNTDLLFSAIERITSAILPKTPAPATSSVVVTTHNATSTGTTDTTSGTDVTKSGVVPK
jgi:hypothetical protein